MCDPEPGQVRRAFLDERRAICERRMDTLHAPVYDERWGSYVNPTHRECVDALVARLSPGAMVLDVACGTGKYWPMLREAGVGVIGIDQSRAMLEVASGKHPDVEVMHGSLQELVAWVHGRERVDGLLCIDAMENVGPEDWPTVVRGFAAVLRPGAPAYVTVELPGDDIVMDEEAATAPLVAGEVLEHGGYHFYPPADRARDWLTEPGLRVWAEREGDGYHHFLLERR